MSRPHTVFIQSQALPWRKGLYGGGRPKVKCKILSIFVIPRDFLLFLGEEGAVGIGGVYGAAEPLSVDRHSGVSECG